MRCDGDLRPGWVDIDRNPPPSPPQSSTTVINHDLRKGLQFADIKYDLVYSSHFSEHPSTIGGFVLMKESYRVLKNGSHFRAAVADARLPICACVTDDSDFLAKAADLIGVALPAVELRSSIDHIFAFARAWGHDAPHDPIRC